MSHGRRFEGASRQRTFHRQNDRRPGPHGQEKSACSRSRAPGRKAPVQATAQPSWQGAARPRPYRKPLAGSRKATAPPQPAEGSARGDLRFVAQRPCPCVLQGRGTDLARRAGPRHRAPARAGRHAPPAHQRLKPAAGWRAPPGVVGPTVPHCRPEPRYRYQAKPAFLSDDQIADAEEKLPFVPHAAKSGFEPLRNRKILAACARSGISSALSCRRGSRRWGASPN